MSEEAYLPKKFRVSPDQMKRFFSIAKPVKDKEERITGWRGITDATKAIGKSRRWGANFVKAYQAELERPKRIEPKYIQEFETSDTVRDFITQNKKLKALPIYIATGREAWKLLNKKDPITWTEEDYLKLWNYEGFQESSTGLISFNRAVHLRKWMIHSKQFELPNRPAFTTKGLKGEKGVKKTHYLKTLDEMIRVISAIRYPDTLVMFRIGTECGARISSCLLTKPQDIDYSQGIIIMKEPKVSKIHERDFNKQTLDFVRRYIYDYNIQGNDFLFKRKAPFYNRDFHQAGKTAQIDFDLTSHEAMKHTFVSQASAHGVSLEAVSDQTGTDPNTLKEFYLGIGAQKRRHELLGEPYNVETYGAWIAKLDPYYTQRYDQLKKEIIKVNGFARPQEIKPKKPLEAKEIRPIRWEAVKGIIASPETPEKLRPRWKEALDLHDQGFSDYEIRKRMGWKT